MSTSSPAIGTRFPDFDLPATVPSGETIEETRRTLGDLAGKPLVLFFYPRDNTPGCTLEVCGFRELYDEFAALGVQVVGVSRDNVRSHVKFTRGQNLPYPLLADKDETLIRGLGLMVNKTMYGKPVTGVERTTYVLDAQGIVRAVFAKVSPPGHARAVLDFVAAEFAPSA
jgi:peroxiredoxin Q/BCP